MTFLQRYLDRASRSFGIHLFTLTGLISRSGPISRYPALYWLYANNVRPRFPYKGLQWSLPDKDTDLVVEAPGSSANMAFVQYFLKHNPDKRVASFTHVAAPARYAVRHHIPCVVLSRDVTGYIQSGVTRFPHLYTRRNALRYYASFYRSVLPVIDDVVVGAFHEVRIDPRPTIAAVNEKFGVSFNLGDGVMPKTRGTAADMV